MTHWIVFTHISGLKSVLDGEEYRFASESLASMKAEKMNLTNNPAWNGTFSVTDNIVGLAKLEMKA